MSEEQSTGMCCIELLMNQTLQNYYCTKSYEIIIKSDPTDLRVSDNSGPTELSMNQILHSQRCNTLSFLWLTQELELSGYSAGSSVKVSN